MALPNKKKILFFGEAVTLAHVTRPLVLAKALDPEKYEIHFACAPGNEAILNSARTGKVSSLGWKPYLSSLIHHPIQSIPSKQFLDALAKGAPVYDEATLAQYIEEDLKLLKEIQPDFVVGDFRLSLGVSAAVAKIPYINIANAHWSKYSTRQDFPLPEIPLTKNIGVPLASFLFRLVQSFAFKKHAEPINRLRKKYGLKPLDHPLDFYTSGDHVLYADLPGLIPTQNLPKHHQYIGPIVWSSEPELPKWWNELPADRPNIYVTLGSSGQLDVMPELLKALSEMPVNVLLATAGRSPSPLPSPSGRGLGEGSNIFAAPYLPGLEAAKRSALVICNGGSATAYQALSQGTPILGIASNMDQFLTMGAIEKAGAGILLRAGKTNAGEIKKAASKILENSSYKNTAADLAGQFTEENCTEKFRNLVESLAGRSYFSFHKS